MHITRTAANDELSSPKASTFNDDIMAPIKTLKVDICTPNQAISDSLSLKFNKLKLEFQRVSKEVSELKTSYATWLKNLRVKLLDWRAANPLRIPNLL